VKQPRPDSPAGGPRQATPLGATFEPWERELVQLTARRIRTTERDELESELSRHLLRLRDHHPDGIRDWRAFLATSLRNKAVNWIRDQHAREKRLVALDESRKDDDDETRLFKHVLKSTEPDHDLSIALDGVLRDLDPELRMAWRVLLEENGNQAVVAKRLRKHRNTIRNWIRRIQEILERHGFQG
jgi:DNA-directed RNA polymerase specialized sigma24 family protein